MIVDFYDADKPCDGPVQRDVHSVPLVGSEIAWHRGESTVYVVVSVIHVFEDRDWYKNRLDIGGDHICVTLKKVR